MTTGQRIRTERLKAGLTQEQLAERVFASPDTVYFWEHDHVRPRPAFLLRLCELFGCTITYITGEDQYER